MKLADVNVLVAWSHDGHPDHKAARAWFTDNQVTTCPITELGMVRVLMQLGLSHDDAQTQLATVKGKADFIPCDLPASDIAGRVTNHRETTDAYLLELARAHKLTLATFDMGIKGAELVK